MFRIGKFKLLKKVAADILPFFDGCRASSMGRDCSADAAVAAAVAGSPGSLTYTGSGAWIVHIIRLRSLFERVNRVWCWLRRELSVIFCGKKKLKWMGIRDTIFDIAFSFRKLSSFKTGLVKVQMVG